MKKYLVVPFAALSLAACGAPVGEVGESESALVLDPLVDFDQTGTSSLLAFYQPPTPVADGSVVDSVYSGAGVTFSCIACADGHAYARFSTSFGSNVVSPVPPSVSFIPAFDAGSGAVRADFTTPRSWVSVDAVPMILPEGLGTRTARAWFEAYDANNQMVGRMHYPYYYGDPQWGTAQTLSVGSATANIKWVRFSSQSISGQPKVLAAFDNLRFNGDPLKAVGPIERPIKLRPFP
jgi:hypothetical protein